jgi:hypothetical protein
MAAKSVTLSNNLLALLFNGTSIANLAENASVAPLTQLWVALHTASPGASGTQATAEAAYTGYARQALPRSTLGFTVSGASCSPAVNVTFPVCTANAEFETFFSVGVAATGAGEILYFGPIAPVIAVQVGVTPQLSTATIIGET